MKDCRMQHWKRLLTGALTAGTALSGFAAQAVAATGPTTPIQHVIVIFEENRTFDNYFGTYPNAANNPGETSWIGVPAPTFTPKPNTPTVNGLTPELLTNNPNINKNGVKVNPIRLRPADAITCSNNNDYTSTQLSEDSGLMDRFPSHAAASGQGCLADGSTDLGYYDGNTVTALWNYAQMYSMSDNHYDTTYGSSLIGHINLVSGNTHGAILHNATTNGSVFINPADGSVTAIGNIAGFLDDCGDDRGGTSKSATLEFTGTNVGDLMNAQGVTWGWFQGGFKATKAATLKADGTTSSPAQCNTAHTNHQFTVNGTTFKVPNPTINPGSDTHTSATDYATSVVPFQHYASTRNVHHLPASSVAAIGSNDQANHQYDISDFFTVLAAGNVPQVSYLKAPSYQYGHGFNSDPLTEQTFIVQTINAIVASPIWASTAIIIAWDDSGGDYDHVMGPVANPSMISSDGLAGAGTCGTPGTGADLARCGVGPRMPLMVISPWAKENYVDHVQTDLTSVLAFIEQNFTLGFIDGPVAPAKGTGSFDRYAGSMMGMFDFTSKPNLSRPILDPIMGTVVSVN
ncbi:MAG TPA: alkaline phosphatase family protein [Aliidongia sp.]|nr:alkaline phosphatase family protein [Aliidongia sp.]